MVNYISINLRYFVSLSGMTQDEFGEYFGLKRSVIGTYIRGAAEPGIEFIQAVCKKHNVTVDDFLNKNIRNQPIVVQMVMDDNITVPQNPSGTVLLSGNLEDISKAFISYIGQLEKEINQLKGRVFYLEQKVS